MRTRPRMAQECADLVGNFRREDMLEFAGLLLDLRFAVHRQAVGKQALRQSVTADDAPGPSNSEFFPQHTPGGIGAPCGHVLGWPRNVQILSVTSGERICSNLQACCSISDSSIS